MPGAVARLVLSRIEKNGFVIPAIPALSAAVGGAARGVARAVGGAGKSTGKMLWRGAKAEPLTVGMTLATAPLLLPLLKSDPAAKAEAKATTQYYASQIKRRGPQMTRYASVFDEADLRAAAAIQRSLEKQAAKVRIPGHRANTPREIFRDMQAQLNRIAQGQVDDRATAQKMMDDAAKAAKKGKKGWGRSKIGPLRKWPVHRIFAAGLALGAAHAVSQQAAAGVNYGIGKAVSGGSTRDKNRQWLNVVKADPGLKKERLARNYFNVLYRASPYIASEPIIAAATVRSMVETPSLAEGGVPAISPKVLKDIIDVEKSRQETRFPWMRSTAGPVKMPTNMLEMG